MPHPKNSRAGYKYGSASKRTASLPENLRVRPSHVIRNQRQCLRRSTRRQLLCGHPRNHPSEKASHRLDILIELRSFSPLGQLQQAIRIRRRPGDPLSPRHLNCGRNKLPGSNHHLVPQAGQSVGVASVNRPKNLPASPVQARGDVLRPAPSLQSHRLQSRYRPDRFSINLSPGFNCRQPHAHSRERPRSRCHPISINLSHPDASLLQHITNRRQQPQRIVLRRFMSGDAHDFIPAQQRDATPPITRIYRQYNHFRILAHLRQLPSFPSPFYNPTFRHTPQSAHLKATLCH
jgi:hypothetical protein